jgi:hypothetical protein
MTRRVRLTCPAPSATHTTQWPLAWTIPHRCCTDTCPSPHIPCSFAETYAVVCPSKSTQKQATVSSPGPHPQPRTPRSGPWPYDYSPLLHQPSPHTQYAHEQARRLTCPAPSATHTTQCPLALQIPLCCTNPPLTHSMHMSRLVGSPAPRPQPRTPRGAPWPQDFPAAARYPSPHSSTSIRRL